MRLIKSHLGPIAGILTCAVILAFAAREGMDNRRICERTANPALCELSFDAGETAGNAVRIANER